jgi:ClpP class serine protease
MDTIKEGRFEDTNKMFEEPAKFDYHVNKWFDDTHQQLVSVVRNYMRKQDDIKHDRVEGATTERI